MREMVKELKEFGVEGYGHDPLLNKEEIEGFGVRSVNRLESVKRDGVIVAVVHDEFKKIKLGDIRKFMNDKPVLIDVRGMFSEEEAKKKGFYYRRL